MGRSKTPKRGIVHAAWMAAAALLMLTAGNLAVNAARAEHGAAAPDTAPQAVAAIAPANPAPALRGAYD